MSPEPIYEVHREAQLDRPVLVVALDGWVDAGMGSANAMTTLLANADEAPLVTFDAGRLLDQRARRPVARIVDGVATELTWPTTVVRSGHDDRGADVLFLVGAEPDFHWRDFIDAVVELSVRWGVRMAVGLGAFPAPAPHTRPVRLAATAPPSSARLVAEVGVVQGDLEVPAGVHTAVGLALGEVGIEAVDLWARVPHYVSAMPFPAAGAALVEGLGAVAGLSFDSSSLRAAADVSRRQVDELVAGNPEHLAMIGKLEQAVDSAEGNALGATGDLPTGEEIAAEFERYLRDEDG